MVALGPVRVMGAGVVVMECVKEVNKILNTGVCAIE